MTQNGGQGVITQKNEIYLFNFLAPAYTAVRHANGRDWWLVLSLENSETYFFFLIDPQGVHPPMVRQVSDSWIPGQYYNLMCTFSPDGRRFVRLGGDQPAAFRLYEVDRCSGNLYNPVTIPVPDTTIYAAWACFSPNSRYLYLTNEGQRLYQYDLQAPDIGASATLIDTYDGFLSVYGLPTGLHAMCLGPDNRIYMTSTNGANLLHTIHNPDAAGAACDFWQHDRVLPAHVLFFLPNQPHYRLYNEPGTTCDSLNLQAPIVAFWRADADSSLGGLGRQFKDLSYFQAQSHVWDFGDGASSTVPSPAHVFPAPGDYQVCLEVCNAAGWCDTLCRTLSVGTSGEATPLPEGTPVRLYPNPAADHCWLNYSAEEAAPVWFLYDAWGRQLRRMLLPKGALSQRIDLSDLQPGWYFWTLQTPRGPLGSGKLLREK